MHSYSFSIPASWVPLPIKTVWSSGALSHLQDNFVSQLKWELSFCGIATIPPHFLFLNYSSATYPSHHPFIHSLSKHFWSACHVQGTAEGGRVWLTQMLLSSLKSAESPTTFLGSFIPSSQYQFGMFLKEVGHSNRNIILCGCSVICSMTGMCYVWGEHLWLLRNGTVPPVKNMDMLMVLPIGQKQTRNKGKLCACHTQNIEADIWTLHYFKAMYLWPCHVLMVKIRAWATRKEPLKRNPWNTASRTQPPCAVWHTARRTSMHLLTLVSLHSLIIRFIQMSHLPETLTKLKAHS